MSINSLDQRTKNMSISDNDSDDNNWSDCGGDDDFDEELSNVQCLFCSHCEQNVDQLLSHLSHEHDFNFKSIVARLHLEFYDYIKFINYIRVNKPTPEQLTVNFNVNLLKDNGLLKPIIEDDLFLQYDIEELVANNGEEHEEEQVSEVQRLNTQLGIAEERARLAEEFLERTIDDLGKCRKQLNKLLLGGGVDNDKVNGASKVNGKVNVDSNGHSTNASHTGDHEAYFSSYSHYSIHEEMLKDTVRTLAYQSFVMDNPRLFDGARVMDVGCGTGILSMFASRGGAREVIAVDFSEIAYQAMDVVKENQLDKQIRVVRGKAEDVDIKGKIDIIVSEWMGYFLLFESMLDTVIYCRDNYLSESGCIYPDKCNITIAALDDSDLYADKMHYWDDVYGFKMSAMRSMTILEPLIEVVQKDKLISHPFVLKEFDLMKISVSDLELEEDFSLKVTRDGTLSALVGYFDIDFETKLDNPVHFSTSPSAVPTHWKQTVFFLKQPITVKEGDCVQGRLSCKKNLKDTRSLDIDITIDVDDTTSYCQSYCMS